MSRVDSVLRKESAKPGRAQPTSQIIGHMPALRQSEHVL